MRSLKNIFFGGKEAASEKAFIKMIDLTSKLTDEHLFDMVEYLRAVRDVGVASPTHWLLPYAQRIATGIARREYPEVEQWEVLPDIAGVLGQIDNMVCGMERIKGGRDPAQHAKNKAMLKAGIAYAAEVFAAEKAGGRA